MQYDVNIKWWQTVYSKGDNTLNIELGGISRRGT